MEILSHLPNLEVFDISGKFPIEHLLKFYLKGLDNLPNSRIRKLYIILTGSAIMD